MFYHTLQQALDSRYLTADLQKLAALLCSKVPSRKDERLKLIVTTLFNDLQGVYKQLPQIAQHAVSETVHTWDGTFQGRMFNNKYKSSPWSQKENHSQMILLDFFLIGNSMPQDLFEKLKNIVPLPPKDSIKYTTNDELSDTELSVKNTSRAALVNLATFLNLTADSKIRVSAKTGKGTAATIRKMNELLYEPDWYEEDQDIDYMQAYAWPLLLQGGRLAKADGSFLKLTPAGRKAAQKDLAGGIKTIWEKWEKSKITDEFARVTAIKGQRSNRGRTMTTPVKRRPMINNLLKDIKPGEWISIDEFARIMQSKTTYSFEMVNHEWKLHFSDQHYGHIDDGDTWPLLQLRYILVYLFEYCATLGIIDIAYDEPHGARSEDYASCWGAWDLPYLSHCDGLQYFRVNDLGAFVMGHSDEYNEQEHDGDLFSFDSNELIILNIDALPPGQELYLDKIAERTEVDRYRFSRSTLLNAINGGESLSVIKKTLQDSATEDFSEELSLLFKDVAYRSTAFMSEGQATLIKCSPEARKMTLANKKLSSLCMPAGDKYLVATPGKELQFIKALEAAGYVLGYK